MQLFLDSYGFEVVVGLIALVLFVLFAKVIYHGLLKKK